jgi:hypothetical protein
MAKKWMVTLLTCIVACLAFCTSAKKAQQPVKYIPTTYEGHIKPLIVTKCAPCHLDDGKEVSYDNYESAKENINDIIRRIKLNPEQHGFMPEKSPKLPDSLIHVFEQWKTDSLPLK